MYIDVIKGQELNVYISESLENPEVVSRVMRKIDFGHW